MIPRPRPIHRRPLLGASVFLLAGCAIDPAGICNSDVEDCEIEQAEQEVVYGTDDRKEYSDPTVSAAHKKLADSTALVATRHPDLGLTCTSSTCTIPREVLSGEDSAGNYAFGLCSGERFGPTATLPDGQRVALPGHGSGVLVAPDVLATAAHVVDPVAANLFGCGQLAVVFGYTATSSGDAPASVPAANVYSCSAVLLHDTAKDVALIRLDRAVTGRAAVPLRRSRSTPRTSPLLLAGHPDKYPLKLAGGGKLIDNAPVDFFGATVDAFHGNSGGPVFNATTGVLEGLVSEGQPDYLVESPSTAGACLRVNACADSGCAGRTETIARSASIASLVPDQSPRAFTATTPTIDGAYARVASGDFDGDGRSDVLFHAADGGADAIWYGKFDKTQNAPAIAVPDGYGVPLVGDFDGDGRSDIFWYKSGTGQDRIWWGDATRPNFGTAAKTTLMKEDGVGYAPTVGDFDGDGDSDILWYGRGTSAPAEKIWWSNKNRNGQPKSGTPTFTSQAKSVSATNFFPIAGDFDADGKDDIFWFAPGNVNASFWRHTTGTSFATTKLTLPTTLGASHRAYAGDFDGNGAEDLLFYASGATTDYAFWFRIDQKGKYVAKTVSLTGSYKPAVGDFNGDSAADVLFYGTGTKPDYRLWGRLL